MSPNESVIMNTNARINLNESLSTSMRSYNKYQCVYKFIAESE